MLWLRMSSDKVTAFVREKAAQRGVLKRRRGAVEEVIRSACYRRRMYNVRKERA